MFCKNCGANIDDDSRFCINCGVRISHSDDISDEESCVDYTENTEIKNELDVIKPADRTNTLSESNSEELPVNKTDIPKRTKRMLFIIGGCIVAIAAVLIVLLTAAKKESVKLPYGLKPGMSLRQAHQKMEDAGFAYWRDGNNTGEAEYFNGGAFGFKTSYTIMEVRYSGYIQVMLLFDDSGRGPYSKENKGPRYQKVYDELVEKYGEPEEGSLYPDYEWRNGKYSISLWSYGNNSFNVYYAYDPDD